MRLYLDVCSLHRPYDDQGIDRNRLEAEAVVMILGRVDAGVHTLVSSEAIDLEVSASPDSEKAELVAESLSLAGEYIRVTAAVVKRAQQLAGAGFRRLDSLHIACAEAGRCRYFITTDDKLARRAKLHRKLLSVAAMNPLTFVTEVDP
jgi:predicted nucleic acid-binding protein